MVVINVDDSFYDFEHFQTPILDTNDKKNQQGIKLYHCAATVITLFNALCRKGRLSIRVSSLKIHLLRACVQAGELKIGTFYIENKLTYCVNNSCERYPSSNKPCIRFYSQYEYAAYNNS